MRKLVMRLQPSNFEDLAALLALYRPGPLQSGMVDQFINRKHGREAIEYPHESLEPILKDTYGTCLTGDTILTDAISGKKLRLDQVRHRNHLLVQGVDEHLRPAIARVTHFFDQGEKPVFELALANGRTIKATADHKILTPQGWTELQDLMPGDSVGTPLQEYRLESFRFQPGTRFGHGELRAFDELPLPEEAETTTLLLAPSSDTIHLEHLSRVRWVEIDSITPAGEGRWNGEAMPTLPLSDLGGGPRRALVAVEADAPLKLLIDARLRHSGPFVVRDGVNLTGIIRDEELFRCLIHVRPAAEGAAAPARSRAQRHGSSESSSPGAYRRS